MHFTPKTYIARSIFDLSCVTYKKLVPSMSWEVIEFFNDSESNCQKQHYWFKLSYQQVNKMPKFTYAAVAGCRPGFLKVELLLTWDWLFLNIT